MNERFQYFQDFDGQEWQGVLRYAGQKISHSCHSQANIDSLESHGKISRHNAVISLIAEEALEESMI